MENVLVEFDAVVLDLNQRVRQKREAQCIACTKDGGVRLYVASIGEHHLPLLKLCDLRLYKNGSTLDIQQQIIVTRGETGTPEVKCGKWQSSGMQEPEVDPHALILMQEQAVKDEHAQAIGETLCQAGYLVIIGSIEDVPWDEPRAI